MTHPKIICAWQGQHTRAWAPHPCVAPPSAGRYVSMDAPELLALVSAAKSASIALAETEDRPFPRLEVLLTALRDWDALK